MKWWTRRRLRRKYMRAAAELAEEFNTMLRDAAQEHVDAVLRQQAPPAERTLAEKVLAGDAVTLGVNPDTGMTIVAERDDSARIDANHRALRAQAAAECGVTTGFGVTRAGAVAIVDVCCERHPRYAYTRCELERGHDGPCRARAPRGSGAEAEHVEWFANADECPGYVPDSYEGVGSCGNCGESAHDPEDDGAVPEPAEVEAVMRAGVCDSVDLVGELVLYETDGRGGKRYACPAIVTMVQRTHVDLPLLRGAQEAGYSAVHRDNTWHDEVHGKPMTFDQHMGVAAFNDGYRVGDNPLPIPHDGTVHLRVFSPGEPYRELSVPYDPTGKTPRSWRYRSGAPF